VFMVQKLSPKIHTFDKKSIFSFLPNFYHFSVFLPKLWGTMLHTNVQNCHSTLFVLHRVTEHLVSDLACCSFLYEEFTCFHFLTFTHQTLSKIQEIVKFIKIFLFLSFSLSSF